MDLIANQRYQSIRHQLDTLHYSQPFNIESSALVERLLSDLLKTTEAYSKVKQELALITNENKLNQQALVPLQKENERLARESNALHFDIIKAKEELESVDLKWKSALRQITNEAQDLRFLVDQKDIKIKKQDQDLTKMKGKYEKILAKMYISTQDEVIEGLAPNILERGEMNVLMKGHQQDFQMSSPMVKYNNDISDLVHEESYHQQHQQERNINFGTQATSDNKEHLSQVQKKWAEELARSDDRCQLLLQQHAHLTQSKQELQILIDTLERQLTLREDEIKRLHQFYEGGQNLEKLNVKFVHENNEKTISKLQNQVEFLNKECHRMGQQVEFLKGGKSSVDEFQQLRNEVNELTFENQSLRKDLSECSKLLKDYQEKDLVSQHHQKSQSDQEKLYSSELQAKLRDFQIEHDKLKQEYERVQSVKGAYTADKKVFIDRIQELEQQVKGKDLEKAQIELRFQQLDQSLIQYRNEINFLNGKCSTLKRDLEYQENYMQKYKDENTKLGQENEYLKMKIDQQDKDCLLMRKQVNGLQEDNDRINRLYQVVEKEAFTSNVYKKQHFEGGYQAQEEILKQKEKAQVQGKSSSSQPTPKSAKDAHSKWKVVEDDFVGQNTAQFSSQPRLVQDENQITVKRQY